MEGLLEITVNPHNTALITRRPHFRTALITAWGPKQLSSKSGLHNSESSKRQIDQHKFAAGRKSLFRCSLEEIPEWQSIYRSRAFATQLCNCESSRGPQEKFYGPCVVHTGSEPPAEAARYSKALRIPRTQYFSEFVNYSTNLSKLYEAFSYCEVSIKYCKKSSNSS